MTERDGTGRQQGFSLLELIAALTILVAVIGMLGSLVGDTRRAWQQGTERAHAATTARAAFALLDGDLRAARARTNLTFVLRAPSEPGPPWLTAWDGSLAFHRLAIEPHRVADESGDDRAVRALQQIHLSVSTNALGLAELRRQVRLIPADLDPDDPDNSLWADDWPDWDRLDLEPSAPILTNLTAIRWRVPYEFLPWVVAPETGPDPDPDADPDSPPATADPPWREQVGVAEYRSADHAHRLPPLLDLEVSLLPERLARQAQSLTPSQRVAFVRQHSIPFAVRFHLRQYEEEGGP